MRYFSFIYLAAAANQLIPKWAKNWEHLDQVAEFRNALKNLPPDERKKSLECWRRIGKRLWWAFTLPTSRLDGFLNTDDEYARDWLLYEARRINASYFPQVVLASNDKQPDDKIEMLLEENPTDSLLRYVQKRLVNRMRVCPRSDCGKFFFRERNKQKYCGQKCAENANREGKLRSYHTSPNSRKNRPKGVEKISLQN
jgi:hypothetical protein